MGMVQGKHHMGWGRGDGGGLTVVEGVLSTVAAMELVSACKLTVWSRYWSCRI